MGQKTIGNEKDYIYDLELEIYELNEYNAPKPYAYQNLFARLVEKHLNQIEEDMTTTMKYGLAWVLISLSFQVVKPMEGYMKLKARTWFSQRKGPYFRREYEFMDENGELLFKGTTFSILLDLASRHVYRKKDTPFPIHDPVADFAIEASPAFDADMAYQKVHERQVLNSFIDCLGHVNNCRYGEFAYDTFTEEEKKALSKLKRMDIHFHSELRNNDTFSMLKARDGNKIFIRGTNDNKGEKAFDIILAFESI